jgi:type II secretory pathway pseudopilin PulG
MEAFPALTPNEIGFDLGTPNISEVATFAGPVRFRHSQRINNHALQLVFRGISQAQVNQLRQHYSDAGGTHRYFELPVAAWGGLTVVNNSSLYRYASTPEEDHQGLYYNVSISLKIVDGVTTLFILSCGGAAQPTPYAFTSTAFTGYAPFILNAGGATPTLILQGRGASQ